MDADVDSAWICTQAIVSTDSQSDDEQEKINNYGYIVLNDMIDNERYILKEGDNTIGRHPLNHIYIEHPSVSMNHAVIQCDSDGVVLLDKGSLNKTKLNKKILRKDVAYFLEENTLLMFGEVQADYFINEKSIEFKNDTKSMAPANNFVHKETQNDGLSLSKLSNTVITPKSFRTDIPNAISDCNVSLVIENKSTCKIEKEVPKTITGTECTMNTLNDIHSKLNSSSPSDEYLLEALSQVETKQNNVNSNEIVHNLSNEDTLIMNLTESVSEITREDTPSPVMDLKSSILTTNNVTKNLFQSPNKINSEAMREDTPSPVMDLKSSILTTNNVTKNQFQSPTKINTEAIREDTPSPVMNLKSSILTTNNVTKNQFQSPNKINTEAMREDSPSPVMNLKSSILTTNNVTKNQFQSPNKINTEAMREDTPSPVMNLKSSILTTNNVTKNQFQSPNKINTEAMREDSPSPVMNLKSSILTTNNVTKNQFQSPNKINTEAMREDTPSPVMNLKSSILTTNNVPTNIFQSPSKINKELIREDTPSPIMDFGCCNDFENNLETNNHGIISGIQSPNEVDKFNNTQVDNNIVELYTHTSNNDEVQNVESGEQSIIPIKNCLDFHSNNHLSGSNNINLSTNGNNTDKHKIIVNTFEADDDDVFRHFIEEECKSQQHDLKILENQDFFNCPAQKVSIKKNIQSKVTSSIHKKESQNLIDHSKSIKNNASTSTIIHDDLTQITEMDDDFFNCPTQKVSTSKKVRPKESSSIHDEETQELLGFSKPCKSNSIVSKSYSSSIHEENTQNAKIDDDFFNCPTQKLSISKNIFPKPKVSHSIHEEETQKPPEFSQFDKTNNIVSNNYSTNINKDLTEVPEMDDDFFNCPTQKVSITKKLNPKPKVPSSINDEETQELLEFSKPCKSNSIVSKSYSSSIHEENHQNAKIDDDFFNCPTQKLSTSKKINPKPKVFSSIHDEETQRPPEFSQFDKTNTITSKTYSISMHEENTQNPKIDDDFFNCPTQKLSISKNTFPKPKVSHSIHEEETQRPPEFSQFDKTNNIVSNNYSTNINKDLTEVPEMDDDFFNCPTQKVSITKKLNPKPKVPSSINDEETQELLEFSKPCKSNSIVSKSYSTSIHEENHQNAKIDDDFFNCPTQKLSTSKKINPKPKVFSSIHDEETQRPPEFSQLDKTNNIASNNYSTNINKDLTGVPEMDDDFFNCPTQKLSISKNKFPKPKVSHSIHEEETQIPPEFSQFNKTNNIVSNNYSTNINKDLIEVPEMDVDFFNCPTQKLSISKNKFPKPKVSHSIHEEETQIPPEFSQFNKTNNIVSYNYSTNINKDLTEVPEMDVDFFNCPTQKVLITKKLNPKPKVSSSINDEETQELLEFSKPCKSNTIVSKSYSTSIHEENTQNLEIDDDFFNCPTQKVSTSKKVRPKVSSSINDEETQELLEFSKPCKSNSIVSKSYSTSIHEENHQNAKIDDDFFNCPTQKLSTSKKINPKPKVFSSIHDEETQRPPEFSQFDKTNTITSKTYSISMHEEKTQNPKIDDDFFNCPTQKLSISKNIFPKPKVSHSIHEEETQRPPEFSQFDKTNNIVSNNYSTNINKDLTEVPETDDDFFNCPTQKVSITKKLNPKPKVPSSINDEETQRPPEFSQFDKTNNQKSKFVKSNIISPSNVQLPVMCNENSSNSLRTNKPNIRVREDLHNMSYSDGSSNNSTIILNKPNKNSVFNNINTTVPFNKNFDSPGCSKTTTIKKNDINASSSTKQECFIDDSDQSQVSISLIYNSHLKQINESIFSPLNIPD
ncbi:uncharacterized protein LOC132941080 isoform X2 [Metopolophium dirhodum]|nr:uncharacterized protein LOC132941080 isoform X2 [Metopolophium dirhodum]